MIVIVLRASMEGHWYLQNTISITIAVLVLLVSSPDSVQAQCNNVYVKEPRPELFCNPYLLDEVHLACTLLVDSFVPVSVDLSVEWYHVPSGQSEPQLIGRSDFSPLVTTHEGFSSEIIIRNVVEGSYYCQPVMAGRGPLLPSQSTRIDPFYSQSFPCNILAAPSSRCAEEGVALQHAHPFIYSPITLTEFADLDTVLTPSPPPALIPGCPYQYIEEPPLDPTCNPYPANAIQLSCALLIDASRVPGGILMMDWIYQSSDGASPTVLQSVFRPIDVGIGLATVRTTFTVTVSNRPDGTYYCQPFLQGSIAILPSKQLMIRPAGSYDSLPPCNGEVVSVPSMRCAMTGEDILNRNGTQNGTMQGAPSNESPTSTSNNSSSGLPVGIYAIVAIGTIIFVGGHCIAVIACVMFCRRKKTKATVANGTGQTLSGESTSIYSLSPLITRGQSEAPSTRTSNSQDQYHYYSRPQWHTSRDDAEQTVTSSEAYILPRVHADVDSSNNDGSGICSRCGSNDNDEPTTEREYESLTDATTSTERPIRTPFPYEEAVSINTDYCNYSTSVRVCVKKSSKEGLDPTEGGEEDISYENNSPYNLPAVSIQRAEGGTCNKGQNDRKNLPARPKTPAGTYQGLNVESMDYTSLYSRRVAPSSSQIYRALESSKM